MGRDIGAILSFIFGLPILVAVAFFVLSSMISPDAENISQGGELIAAAATPWWIGVFEGLAALPFAAFFVLAFIFFLKYIGQIR